MTRPSLKRREPVRTYTTYTWGLDGALTHNRGEGSRRAGGQGQGQGTSKHRYTGHQEERQEINISGVSRRIRRERQSRRFEGIALRWNVADDCFPKFSVDFRDTS